MELELFAPRISLIPAPVYLPAIPGLCEDACAELSGCRHLHSVCAALAQQQEGAGLVKGGSAIPLPHFLQSPSCSLSTGKEDKTRIKAFVSFLRSTLLLLGKL